MRLITSAGDRPCSSSAIAFGPYCRFADACVATAPTPGLAYGTAAPAAQARDCTPTPSSLGAGSKAMIEKVENHGSDRGPEGCAPPAPAATSSATRSVLNVVPPD